MSILEKINVGLVGAAGRGGTLHMAMKRGGASIHAVCDIREHELESAKERFEVEEAYTDVSDMLGKSHSMRSLSEPPWTCTYHSRSWHWIMGSMY